MEHKSNSYKVNRQQREKVLRFSIRKYSFGAASVAVAALMFLSGHQAVRVEAAQVSDTTEVPVIPDKEDAHTATIVDLPKTEDSLTTDKEEKSLTTAENPAETLSEKLPETSTENTSENETTALDKEVVEKQTLDKTKLQANITKVQELLDKVNKEKAPASTLAAIQADLETANSVLNNNSLELTQAEIDAAAKTLSDKLFILSSMPKIGTPEKVVKEGKNTIANTGSRDSRNGETMEEGSDLRSAPIDKNTKRGELGIVVANSGFITGYATPSSTIEIKRNGTTVLTSTLDDTGAFKLNAPGIEVGDVVELVVNGQTVTTTTVKQTDTVAFNDSLAGIAQVDGYTAAEADVEVTVGGKTYTTRSQSNGYFTVNVDTKLMVKDAVVTTVVKKNGKKVGSGTSTVRDTKVTDFGVGWIKNPMINYSERDVYSPDTKQYAFVSKGTADKAYDNIRVYREERIEKDGNKYYYWILDSGPAANAQAGLSKKVSLTIPRSVGDPYDFTYTKYADGVQYSHNEYANATAWEHENSNYRAYVKNGERRSGASYTENLGSWMDYANPDNNWWRNIYRDSRQDGTDRNPDAASRVKDMYGITTGGLIYNLGRGVIEDKLNVKKGQRTIITFKTKILEGDELDQSIMSDWGNKDKNNPMLADIKKRLANDPYLAYGGYTDLGYVRYRNGQNAIIGTLPLKPEEAERYNIKPRAKEQSTKVGVIPDAYNSIANPNELPAGTTYRWFKDPDVSRPTAPNAPVYGKVEVIIPERGTSIVDAPIHVTEDKAKTPEAPSATAKEDGSVTAKPQDSTKVDKIKVSYTGEDGSNKTAEGNKGGNGTWTVTGNPDVQIVASTGEITIPADKVKDNTEVTAVTTNGNSDESAPAKATAKAPKPEKPILTAPNNGNVTAKPQDPAKADKITVTYKDEDGTNVTVVGNKGNDGTWTVVNNPGVTIDSNTGEITIPADKVRDNTVVTAITKNGNSVDSDPATETARAPKPETPTVTANEDGSVTAKPQDPEKADKITVTYTGEDDLPKEVVGTKDKFGQWTSDDTEIKINADTGEITIPAEKVKNETVVKAITKNGTSDDSDPATDKAKTPDNEPPILTLSANNLKVVEGETITFRVKAKDDKNVTFEATEFLAKYFKRYNVGTTGVVSSRYVKNTEKEKEIEITINTIAEDVGKQNTIIFNATDDAGNKATPVIFSFDVTPRDRTAPTISANGATVTNREEIIPIPVTAKDNDGGVGMRENTPIEVKDLPDGLKFENNQIVGTPTGALGVTKVTITAYDKNDNKAEKTIEIVVKGQNDKYNPVGINRTVPKNSTPNAEDSIGNKQDLPQGTKYHWLTPPDTSQGGQTVSAVVVVEYPDKTTDNVSVNISVPTNLTAEVTKPNEVLEKRAVDPKKVVIPNKDGSTIATEKAENGLTVNGEGKLTGTPTVDSWGKDEEKRAITIPVKVTNGNEEITVSVPVTILRDTDGDGNPDVTDPDDDNDGVSDEDEKKKGTDPKVFDKPDNPTSYGLTGVVKPSTVTENKQVTEPGVVTPNKTGATIETPTAINGLTVGNDGSLTGTPKVDSWGEGEEERDITIPVKVKNGNEEANVIVPVKIQRDTDGDGNPDVTDTDDDNDGISDEDEKRNGTDPKVANGLTGIVTAPAKVKEKTPVPTPLPKVVTPNKSDATIEPSEPVNELKVNDKGELEGTPTVNNWNGGEEERNITIPVKITREKDGNPKEEVTVHVPVTIQRDTDGDGIADVDDSDDDNDGISDEDEKKNGTNPKVADGLVVKVTKPNVVMEKKEVTPKEVVTPNKKGATITTTTTDNSGKVNGLTVNEEGKLTGTPTVDNWGDDEEKTINIPVKVTKDVEKVTANGKETVTETVTDKVPVTIQRDTDGDGEPDVIDKDDDNDGIPDEVEKANGTDPKNANNLTAKVSDPTKVTEKKPVPSTLAKVVTPNKDGSTITTENPVNGLSVDKDGKLTGTPSVTNWGSDEERKINIPVKVKNGDEEIRVEVPVIIQRDTDGDGDPDVTDKDDDNDGISDEEEKKNGTDPKVATTQTPVEITITREKNGDAIVTPKKPDGKPYPKDTKVEIPGENGTTIVVTIGDKGFGTVPNDQLPKGEVPGQGVVTEPNKQPSKPVDVTTPVRKIPTVELTQNPSTGDVTVTPKKIDGSNYPTGTTVTIPGKDGKTIDVIIGENGSGTVLNGDLPERDVPGTAIIKEPNQKPSQPVDITTPAKKVPTLQLDQDPKTGDVTVTPKKPDGTTYPPGTTVEIPGKNGNPITVTIGKDGTGKVPNNDLPETDTPGTGKIKEDGKPEVEIKVETPKKIDPTAPETAELGSIEITRKPNGDAVVTPKTTDGKNYPKDTKVKIPGENGTSIVVTIGENGSGEVLNDQLPKYEVPGKGTVTEPNKKPSQPVAVTTPARKTPTVEMEQNPNTGDVTVTPKKPDGTTYPPGTKVEIPGKDGKTIEVTLDKDGKGTVPNNDLPDEDTPGTGKVKEDGKPEVVVNVETPKKINPNHPATEQPTEIDITRNPNGDAVVTPKKPDGIPYPPGTTVKIPGENGTPIVVTIGKDGFGIVPNDKLPKDEVQGKGTATEPGARPSQPVDVTTPARKPSVIRLDQDPKTGDVTVIPMKPDGSTYPPGTKVEIPGKNGNPIVVTIGEDGKGTIPNNDLPDGNVPGTGKITEPGKPTTEAQVLTPGKINPLAPQTEQPGKIEITRNPNGDAVVTPKKPDGSTYPSGTKVVIPGENGTSIIVTIGDNGSGTVPNDKLPKEAVTGKGIVTEPNKKPSQPVAVTTPARKTPTVELTQDPATGNVTVTPKKPDGTTYPPGTTVEIPGKDGKPIVVPIGNDGTGTVPNNDLPDEDTPGTGRIKEPGKPTVEVKVETPKKIDPTAPETAELGTIEITIKPNGDAVVTPKKKTDKTTYPEGSRVKIPGENGTSIVVTIGKDGSGTVPNDQLPKEAKPGKGTVTEPGTKPSNPVDVTTPARKTPTVELDQDPNTGDVTVTPKKPDGTLYPENTKVEIPGKNGKPIVVIIGKDGKGTIPNKDLPDGIEPGKGTITEPGKDPVEVIVTTPARKTPTLDVYQDPNTGDVTVTPKKPDGSTYPPGTKVEIPGKNGKTITVIIGQDGKGKVPNSELPDGKVPGTGKITEPGQPAVEVPVETPAKVTPATPTDTIPVAPVTPDTPVPPSTDGDSGQDTPTPTSPTPNAVTPNADQVDTKTTVDKGAKSNDSQNVLPNTGTESNATLASLGLLGMLGGLGLALRKKKED